MGHYAPAGSTTSFISWLASKLESGVDSAVENGMTLKPRYTRPRSNICRKTHQTDSMNHGYLKEEEGGKKEKKKSRSERGPKEKK